MNGYEYSIELAMVPLKDQIARINFFWEKHTTAERITQTMDDCKFSRQNKYSTLRRMDERYFFCDKNKYTKSRDGWLQLE